MHALVRRAGAGDAAGDTGLSRAEHAYCRLRDAIRSGELKAGQRLRETDVAAWLGVSRTPVREAIRRLASDRLIENAPGRGLAVTTFDKRQVRELYFVRAVLEGAAAELASQHASDFEISVMRDLLARMRGCLDDPAETARLNRRFHEAIYESARNGYLAQALGPMSDFIALLPGTTFEVAGRAAAALAEHEEILAAIAERAADRADKAARRHIQRAGETRIRMMFDAGSS
ncbi:MAG: GntR family transcriptional regulator [Alphaproteobacteria bacterium]|nr:GntR family transcriptional regulator [Alphaproteobacteria bacterium]